MSSEEPDRSTDPYLNREQVAETPVVFATPVPGAEGAPLERPGGELRPHGLAAGELRVPDAFDLPLPEEVLVAFEGQ